MDKGGDGGKGGWGWRGVCMSLGEGRVYVWVKKKKNLLFPYLCRKRQGVTFTYSYPLHFTLTLYTAKHWELLEICNNNNNNNNTTTTSPKWKNLHWWRWRCRRPQRFQSRRNTCAQSHAGSNAKLDAQTIAPQSPEKKHKDSECRGGRF